MKSRLPSLFLIILSPFLALAELPAPGDRVEAKWGGSWFGATVVKREAARVYVKFDDGIEQWCKPTEIRPISKIDPRFFDNLKVGDKLEVHDGFNWLKSTVLKREGEKVFIRYDDWGQAWDTWITPERARPLGTAGNAAPRAGGGGAGAGTPAEQPADVPSGDLAGAKELKSDAKVPWALKADPAPQPASPIEPKAIALGIKFQRGEKLEEVSFAAAPAPQALLSLWASSQADRPGGLSRIVRVDLASGKPAGIYSFPPKSHLTDISPDGTLALARLGVSGGTGLEVFGLETSTGAAPVPARRLHAWRALSGESRYRTAMFVDEKHVLCVDEEGYAVLWALPAAQTAPPASSPTPIPASAAPAAAGAAPRAIYRLKLGTGFSPFLTPGRKNIVAEAYGDFRFFDALTGQPLGILPDVRHWNSRPAFSPDGRFVCVSDGRKTLVFNVATGKVLREIPLPQGIGAFGGQAIWLSSRHFVVDQSYLVDFLQRQVLWQYKFPEGSPAGVFGGLTFSVFGAPDLHGRTSTEPVLSSARLPHEAAANSGANINMDQFKIFKPGTKIGIDLSTDAPGDLQEKAKTSLEAQFKAMGLEIDPAAPMRAAIVTTAGESRTIQYRMMGRGADQTVSYTEKIHRIAVTENGKELYAASTRSGAPMFVSMKPGQSAQEIVNEQQAGSYKWFTTVQINKDALRPGSFKVQGNSTITPDGVK